MIQPRSLQRRSLGRTSLTLPALGFGGAPIGNLYRPLTHQQAALTLNEVLSQKIEYLDTAPHYGFGLSEERIGAFLARVDQRFLLSTKVGRRLEPCGTTATSGLRHGFAEARDLEPIFDYGHEAVLRQLQESRQRLGRAPDIVYAHDLGPLTHGSQDGSFWTQFCEGGYPALKALRDSGEIQAIGLGVNEIAVCERALAQLDLDVLLLAGRYTLLEQEALVSLLPLCEAKGVSVVIGGAFNSGVLATGVRGPGPHFYNYAPAPDSVLARVAAIEAVCDAFNVPLPAAALQFPIAHPAVISVVAGCAQAGEVRQARQWMDQVIPAAFWDELKARGLLPEQAPCPVLES